VRISELLAGGPKVIDPQTEAILQGIVRRESRSLLAYIGDAYPWTTAAQTAALATLQDGVRAETGAVSALGRFLVRQNLTPPFLGSYPASFTSCNFVALNYLLPRLIDEERRLIAALEADLAKIANETARASVEALLAVKKKNLAMLEGLVTPQPVPA
jgi:hypothetical protein